ncbi:MAG: Xylose isomerase domain protein barrel [Polaromonas sp.]|nr:Xylose isomerase domain protein barrel [Polaromonas sp.]
MPTDASTEAAASTPVLISLTAFGASEVRRHGQLWFTRLCHEAGADGVEVRSELLVDAASELPAIAQAVRDTGMQVVYSSADGLWTADGVLDVEALQHALAAAATLRAPRLKMAIGGFTPACAASLMALSDHLRTTRIELVIENDQTATAGTLPALQKFFDAANERGVFLGMTFDMGNWHWTGECPLQAAAALAPQVRYVHCKGVQRQPQRWVAVPLAASSAPWRAVLRALPADVPWAIEYPLIGDDLLAVTGREISQLRSLAAGMAARSRLPS